MKRLKCASKIADCETLSPFPTHAVALLSIVCDSRSCVKDL